MWLSLWDALVENGWRIDAIVPMSRLSERPERDADADHRRDEDA